MRSFFARFIPRSPFAKAVWIFCSIQVITQLLGASMAWSLVSMVVVAAVLAFINLTDNPIWLRMVAWFNSDLMLIEAVDMQDQRYLTLARYTPNTGWQAPVYWGSRIGCMHLRPDGLVSQHCPSSYMVAWRPVNPELAVNMVLSYPEVPSFDDILEMNLLDKVKIDRS
jgi:hypothetical protein